MLHLRHRLTDTEKKRPVFTESSFDDENIIKGIRHNEVELVY